MKGKQMNIKSFGLGILEEHINTAVKSMLDNYPALLADIDDCTKLKQVEMRLDKRVSTKGDTTASACGRKGQWYSIRFNLDRITPDGDRYHLLPFIIAHELQHLEQLARGYISLDSFGMWKGENIDPNTNYLDLPWEVDANEVAFKLTGINYPHVRKEDRTLAFMLNESKTAP
jgi:hypothetical protein